MGLTCCQAGKQKASKLGTFFFFFKSAPVWKSAADLGEHGGVADAVSVEAGGLWRDVVVHVARLQSRGQDAHVVLPGSSRSVVEPQSGAVRPTCGDHDQDRGPPVKPPVLNNPALACFLRRIIVVDFQPVELLATDGNTHVIRKPERLNWQGGQSKTAFQTAGPGTGPLGGGPSLTLPPVPHAATTAMQAVSTPPL